MPVMHEAPSGKSHLSESDGIPGLRGLPPAVRIAPLSPAELEVVRAMVAGLSPKEVATKRGTSIATVRTQLKRAKKKTAARTLNELVALVCLAGLEDAGASKPASEITDPAPSDA